PLSTRVPEGQATQTLEKDSSFLSQKDKHEIRSIISQELEEIKDIEQNQTKNIDFKKNLGNKK
ncbi:MAG: hypothetical protein K2X39_07150, partial [Silvanigrellaceae bacterium]|nr:hypothetical protein [Silvanigrellaceae bacterium]